MAISASKSKTIYASASSVYGYTLYVKFTETSTSTPNNTSTISISGYMLGNNIGWSSSYNSYLRLYWHDNNTNTDKLVGSSSGFTSLAMNTKKSVSGSITVTHKSDGSLDGYAKLVYEAGSTSGGYAPSSNNVQTDTTPLTDIPRASSVSSISGSELGSAVTVNINRAVSSFTHKVEYSFAGSSWTTVATSAGTSCSFTPALSLASNIPNATSGTLTVRVTTYSGSAQIGSAVTKTKTLSLPASVVPDIGTISATMVNNGVPSSWGVYVKGYSQAKIDITGASGVYGSTIKSYLISGGGLSAKASSATTDVLNTTGDITFTCTVTDSRGRTASGTISITVVDYSPPSISVQANRCTSGGVASTSGTYLRVTITFTYASVSGKNSISSRACKCNGVTRTSFSSGVAFTFTCNVSAASTYTLTASVTDALGNTASAEVEIPTDVRIMNVRADKKGVAFGKFSEQAGLEVAWPAYFEDAVSLNGIAPFDTGGDIGSSDAPYSSIYAQLLAILAGIRLDADLIGIYGSYADASAGLSRRAWLGFETGANKLTLENEDGGDIALTAGRGQVSVNRLYDLQCGMVSITPTANTVSSVNVTFPHEMASAPRIILCPSTAVPYTTVRGVGHGRASTTGFTLYIYRTNTTATSVHWIAYVDE